MTSSEKISCENPNPNANGPEGTCDIHYRKNKPMKRFSIEKLKKQLKNIKLPSIEDLSREEAMLNTIESKPGSRSSKPNAKSQEDPNEADLLNSTPHVCSDNILAKQLISSPVTQEMIKTSKVCSPQLAELIENLSVALIHEKNKGISTTTLEITDPNSQLCGTQVEIKHYDTAPHSFHLDITTTPELQKELSQNILFLNQRLVHILPECKFYISPPKNKSITSTSKAKGSSTKQDKKKTLHSEKIME